MPIYLFLTCCCGYIAAARASHLGMLAAVAAVAAGAGIDLGFGTADDYIGNVAGTADIAAAVGGGGGAAAPAAICVVAGCARCTAVGPGSERPFRTAQWVIRCYDDDYYNKYY